MPQKIITRLRRPTVATALSPGVVLAATEATAPTTPHEVAPVWRTTCDPLP
ncbi:hypothetical protein AB0L59_17975 [Streptomyces sp. NPDC052109]|uniref:hypothetical protein n=1 Tax=Streptomyces sp. NPDC052109 TaxID=3155527 RepID=UPI00342E7BB6